MTLHHSGWAPLLVLALSTSADVSAQDAARGAALIAAARQAIGGESRLAGVRTLHVTGTFRRVIGANDTEGDFEVFLELPDKYLRSEKTGTPGQPSTEAIEALVGTEPRDVVRGGGGRGGRGGARIGGGGGDDPSAAGDGPAGGDGPPPGDDGDRVAGGGGDAGQSPEANTAGPGRGRGGAGADPETLRRARQGDVARLITMWLLTPPVPMSWIGIAESPDGKANVLEARFADGPSTRLFLDSVSHMPLMLQWQGAAAPLQAGGGRRGGGRQPAEPITFDMRLSDYRVVNGIKLPYLVTRGTNGQTIERWTIRNYRVNPSFRAETFAP